MCIELKKLSFEFADRKLFSFVDAIFKRGFNLIYGNSGSGKTSLLKIINMLYEPSSGAVLYKGKNIETFDTSFWRSICMLTKQTTIFAEGSVMDNVMLPFEFRIHKEKKLNKDVLYELLGRFDLNRDILDEDSKKLSGGESQRIAIIRSVLLEPEIFLFDEPTSALDYDMQEKMFLFIKELSKKHICIVASHAKEAKKYSDFIFKVEGENLINV